MYIIIGNVTIIFVPKNPPKSENPDLINIKQPSIKFFYLTFGKRYPIIPLDTCVATDVVMKASLFPDLLMISNKVERIGLIFIETEKNNPIARITFANINGNWL